MRYEGFALVVWVILMPTACLMGPDYERPQIPEKTQWSQEPSPISSPGQIIRSDWWSNFQDPYLNQLIQTAVAENYNLKILLARIDEAGAGLTTARAAQLPTADLTASAEYTRMGIEGSSSTIDTESYQASASVKWELDIWGKNRRGYLASEASYKASQADYRAGYLKMVSDVATTYFLIREIDEKLIIRERFYKDSLQKLTIYQNQFREGLVPDWQVSRQVAEVKGLKQGLLDLERIRKINQNRLATLLGKPAGDFAVPAATLRDHLQPLTVPAGLPSELLLRRPDVVAAEYRLLAATHRVGGAKAARLPSLSLTGELGVASSALSKLLDQFTLGIAPEIFAPLFDAGRRKADQRVSEARAQIAQNEYLNTVMGAFEEVENALTNLNSRFSQKKLLEEQVKSLERVRLQTRAKFTEGLISQLEVLDIENGLLSAENTLVETHRLLLNDTVTLYKALGGGWPQEVVQ